ncbi:uncharacterized protein LOC135847890 isoform X2 [Planococcus citri]|uniref:uncharacterized protein LOC135847890 isoform X2 n=1 Tax=Planococcus citri TaxID=170843 RepID=UPI0031F7B602
MLLLWISCMNIFAVAFNHGAYTNVQSFRRNSPANSPKTSSLQLDDLCQTQIIKTNLASKKNSINLYSNSFRDLVCKSSIFVDNSLLIHHVLEKGKTLVSLPRAFGKTINLSMIGFFYELQVRNGRLVPRNETDAFKAFVNKKMQCGSVVVKMNRNFLIKKFRSRIDDSVFQDIGSLPVIYLYFGHPQQLSYSSNFDSMVQERIVNAMRYQLDIAKRIASNHNKAADLVNKIEKLIEKVHPPVEDMSNCVFNLIEELHSFYKRKVVVLIDEYDVMLNDVYFGFYSARELEIADKDDILGSFAIFLGDIVKRSKNIHLAVVTGSISCWRDAGMFTELRRMSINTASGGDGNVNRFYGMNPAIVKGILQEVGMADGFETARFFFDGYDFGNDSHAIVKYNPFAIAKFVEQGYVTDPVNFWTANGRVQDLLVHFLKHRKFFHKFCMLLGRISVPIEMAVDSFMINTCSLRELTSIINLDLNYDVSNLYVVRPEQECGESIVNLGFRILLAAGYLTRDRNLTLKMTNDSSESDYEFLYVKIPNQEVLISLWIEFYNTFDGHPTEEVIEKERRYRDTLYQCNFALERFLRDHCSNTRTFTAGVYYNRENSPIFVNYHLRPYIKSLVGAFQKVLDNYLPVSKEIEPGKPNAYRNEAFIQGLLLTIANIESDSIQIMETKHLMSDSDSKVKRGDIVLKTPKGPLTVFEIRTVDSFVDLYTEMSTALDQAKKHVQWYFYGEKFRKYNVNKARAVAVVFSKVRKLVLIGAISVEKASGRGNSTHITYLGHFPEL